MSEHRFAVVLMIGLPGAGKSSLCQRMIDVFELEVSTQQVRVVHVCYDDIIKNWKEQHNTRKEIVECVRLCCSPEFFEKPPEKPRVVSDTIWQRFVDSVLPMMYKGPIRTVFLIDDNMHLRSMRHSYYNLAREERIGFGQIALSVDVSLALVQNVHRCSGIRISDEIIYDMSKSIEMPDGARYPWERNTLFIEQPIDEPSYERVRCFMIECLSDRCIPSRIKVTFGTADEYSLANKLYRWDIALRKIVAEEMAKVSDRSMPGQLGGNVDLLTLGNELSHCKAILLKRLKESNSPDTLTENQLKAMLLNLYEQLKIERLSDSLAMMEGPSHSSI